MWQKMVFEDENITEKKITDERKEEQPSSDGNDIEETRKDETQHQDNKGDGESNTETFISSAGSKLNLDKGNSEISKRLPEKRRPRLKHQKRNRWTYEKADKRRRPNTRRRDSERAPKRLRRVTRERDSSTSTVISKLSSLSRSRSPLCKDCTVCETCGHHHICRRRSVTKRRSRLSNNKKSLKRKKKKLERECKGVQVGSRSAMLSPLFVIERLPNPATSLENKNNNYNKITPEMIYQSIRSLSMWRHYVNTQSIYEYLKRNYPVNPDEKELQEELQEKLRIAAITGLVVQVAEDLWCLSCAMMDQEVFETHVSKFWDAYVDTLQPIAIDKKNPDPEINNKTCDLLSSSRKDLSNDTDM